MKETLVITFLTLAVIGLVGANIVGIGYSLYLWGAEHISFATAAWTAFKLWLALVITGAISLILSLVLKD